MPISAPEFVSKDYESQLFVLEPYIPTGGIVFFYGKKGLGKSPLTWEIARCVGLGVPFLGLSTRQTTVLYVDVDTPEHQVQKRIKGLPQPLPPSWYLEFPSPFNVLQQPEGPAVARLRACAETLRPGLVIINTLRKVHYADDKESSIPARVYGAFQNIFPKAALWFTHHDRKDGDPQQPRNPDEEFSGSQAWINDATVGLHLRKNGGQKGLLRLDHTKSQVSDLKPPLVLQLDENGSCISLYHKGRDEKVLMGYDLTDPSMTKRERVSRTATVVGVSESTVWRVLREHRQDTDSDGIDDGGLS